MADLGLPAAGMVNLCNKNGCQGPNCHKSPRFNYPNVSRGIFCDAHKLEGAHSCKTADQAASAAAQPHSHAHAQVCPSKLLADP